MRFSICQRHITIHSLFESPSRSLFKKIHFMNGLGSTLTRSIASPMKPVTILLHQIKCETDHLDSFISSKELRKGFSSCPNRRFLQNLAKKDLKC